MVRSPLLTSHKWRELVSSGRLVCRCHDVFLWCYLFYAFVEAATLCSIVLRYAGAPIATRVLFLFFSFCLFGDVAFSEYLTIAAFSLYDMESTSYVLFFRRVFFYLVTTGWTFYVSLCENSINQSIKLMHIIYVYSGTDPHYVL